MCGASDPAAVAWCAAGAAWYADDSIPDYVNDPCYRLYLEALAELRRSVAEVSPNEDYGHRLGLWNDVHHRTQADAVRLYDVTHRARGRRCLTTSASRTNQPTCRPPTESSSRPRPGRAKPRSPSTTCPPSRSTRRTSTSRPGSPCRITSTAARPRLPPGTSFGLVVITPPPYDPKVPHHDLDDEAEMCHLNVEYWPTTITVH